MAFVHLLGTGAGLSDAHRTTTMLAFEQPDSVVVVDCGGDVVQRLLAANIDLDRLTALIVTHEHPDHVGGFPLMMEKLWLSGRRRPLPIHGPAVAIDLALKLFSCFDTSDWEGLPALERHDVPLEDNALLLRNSEWAITASPGDHGRTPVIALRIEDRRGGGVAAYSCDTRPSDSVARLARSADLLLHEATGKHPVHSSAEEAAQLARSAQARRLVLVHLPPSDQLTAEELDKARQVFPNLEVGQELGCLPF